ncbi:HPP family protein [Flammeovirgaceae bacterium SG7u.111]|nr:HPP family protein [Flammeovirgaceae bacterium SG7u.132]WPO38325.1 HPP family protein [Flammeovirgaceae bacterium SG7u.111]
MAYYNLARKRIERIYRIGKYILYKETLVDFKDKFWSFLGSFFGIGIIALIQSAYLTENDNVFLIGSFGASCVLIYGAVQSPLAQPRNLIIGHMVSAIIGVTVCQFLPDIIWLTVPLAVSLSIIAMQYTKSLHPPGGATALIAVIGSEKIKTLGYLYIVFPVLSGVVILFSVALITNNMTSKRKYPNDGRFSRNLKWITTPISHYSQKIKVKRAD